MEFLTPTAGIAHEIRLSIAPVFLLTAIAGMLMVFTGRLTRAVDSAVAGHAGTGPGDPGTARPGDAAAMTLLRRIWLIEWAIRLFVSAALLVCAVVVALFLGDYVEHNLAPLIAGLFIISMGLLIAGFVLFLQEVRLASRQTRLDMNALFMGAGQ